MFIKFRDNIQFAASDISEFGPGSDYHELIERVAYRVWESSLGTTDPDVNWNIAKKFVRHAQEERSQRYADNILLNEAIRLNAHYRHHAHHSGLDADGNWYAALNEFADEVSDLSGLHNI